MIKHPEQMDFSDKKFTAIIAGQPGIGKTTLALSAPNPFLLDTDRGISRVSAAHRAVSSEVETYEDLLSDMGSAEYKAAKTIVIDTGGSLVQLMKDWAKQQDSRAAKNGMAMFGVIKQEFDRLVYQIRTTDNKHLVIVFHTTEVQKGDQVTTRLSCEGSSKDIVWTPADFGGYMFVQNGKRKIGFSPTDEYFAKGCYGIRGVMDVPELKVGTPNDFLARLFEQAAKTLAEESAANAEAQQEYEDVMGAGRFLIDGITTPEEATNTAAAIAGYGHKLTSKAELRALLMAKTKELGYSWDKENGCYVENNA